MKTKKQWPTQSPLLILMILALAACAPQEQPNQNNESVLGEEVYVFLQQKVDDKNDWHSQIVKSVQGNASIVEQKCFYNMLDSSIVIGVFLADNVAEADKWCNSLKENDSELEAKYLSEKHPVNLDLGAGEVYLYVTHKVKNFEKWYLYFSAMIPPKEADSLYTLGVLVGPNIPADAAVYDRVHVFARAESMEKASDYGNDLEGGDMLDGAGVLTTDAMVLRVWDFNPNKK